MKKKRLLLIQLGSPRSPNVNHVRWYLWKFLKNRRVVDLSPFLWFPILLGIILPFRGKKSAKAYTTIWNGDSFPLVKMTYELMDNLIFDGVKDCAFILEGRSIFDAIKSWNDKEEELTILPLFPQYCQSTTELCKDQIGDAIKRLKKTKGDYKVIERFYFWKSFIRAWSDKINSFLDEHRDIDLLLFSFHGMPVKMIEKFQDPYQHECEESFTFIAKEIRHQVSMKMSYQSRLGRAEWLSPYTSEVVSEAIQAGATKIAIVAPSFVADCLETLFELGVELKEVAAHKGCELILIDSLNNDPEFMKEITPF